MMDLNRDVWNREALDEVLILTCHKPITATLIGGAV
jgi:hypothetical protein